MNERMDESLNKLHTYRTEWNNEIPNEVIHGDPTALYKIKRTWFTLVNFQIQLLQHSLQQQGLPLDSDTQKRIERFQKHVTSRLFRKQERLHCRSVQYTDNLIDRILTEYPFKQPDETQRE